MLSFPESFFFFVWNQNEPFLFSAWPRSFTDHQTILNHIFSSHPGTSQPIFLIFEFAALARLKCMKTHYLTQMSNKNRPQVHVSWSYSFLATTLKRQSKLNQKVDCSTYETKWLHCIKETRFIYPLKKCDDQQHL